MKWMRLCGMQHVSWKEKYIQGFVGETDLMENVDGNWKIIVKCLKEMGYVVVNWIYLVQDVVQWQSCKHGKTRAVT
jgi:hypothetical protein